MIGGQIPWTRHFGNRIRPSRFVGPAPIHSIQVATCAVSVFALSNWFQVSVTSEMGKGVTFDPDKDIPDLAGKVVFITGGSPTSRTMDGGR